jgi:hypothetical protein
VGIHISQPPTNRVDSEGVYDCCNGSGSENWCLKVRWSNFAAPPHVAGALIIHFHFSKVAILRSIEK